MVEPYDVEESSKRREEYIQQIIRLSDRMDEIKRNDKAAFDDLQKLSPAERLAWLISNDP
jgi:hypothetical protein